MKWNFAPLMYNFAPSNRAEDKVGWSFSYQERAVVCLGRSFYEELVWLNSNLYSNKNSIEVGYIASITTLEHFIISSYTHFTLSTVMLFHTEAGAKKLRSKRTLYWTNYTVLPKHMARTTILEIVIL